MVVVPSVLSVNRPVCELDGQTFVVRSIEMRPDQLLVHFWLALDSAAREAHERFTAELEAWRARTNFSRPALDAPHPPPARLHDTIVQVADDRGTSYRPAGSEWGDFDGGEREGTAVFRGQIPADAEWLKVQLLDHESEELGQLQVELGNGRR